MHMNEMCINQTNEIHKDNHNTNSEEIFLVMGTALFSKKDNQFAALFINQLRNPNT